jgi:predicted NBD/HSP70 family sugar kinase
VDTGSPGGPAERTRAARPRHADAGNRPLTTEHIRQANAWSVLKAVRAGGIASRTEISAATRLTGMSVHRLIGELASRGLVVPAGRTRAGAIGRPSSLFRFDSSIAHVVGIDVGNETTRAELTDLDHTVRAHREIPTADVEADLAASLIGLIGELRGADAEPRELVGIGIGVPAVAGPDGRIIRASQHHSWEGLDLGSRLRAQFGTEVVVRQDDHLAALAELRGGACQGARSALVLDVGKGVGLGVITDGLVHGGVHQAAGRVAWIPFPTDDGRGAAMVPIGQLLTADGLIADYRRLGGSRAGGGARHVFEADAASEPAAREAVDLFASRLGWLIATVIAVLDPEIVVVGGGISRSFARLAEGVNRQVRSIVLAPPPVVASALGPQAVVTGAIEAALGLADAWLQAQLESS